MIADDIEFRQTKEQLSNLEGSLADLKSTVYPQSPERFRILADSHLTEIKRLRSSIDEYVGVRLAEIESSDLVLRLVSPLFAEGVAPASIVGKTIIALQKGLQNIGEYLARTRFQVSGELSSYLLSKQYELEVVTVTPGSFQIGLRAREVNEPRIPAESMWQALETFGKAIQLASEIDSQQDAFQRLVPELNYQLQILQALKEIAPSRKGPGYSVKFLGRHLHGDITFSPETRTKITGVIRSTSKNAHESGMVREVNLDSGTFIIRTQATNLRCRFHAEMEPQVRKALGQIVSVSGTATIYLDGKVKHLNVRELQVIENER